MRESGARRAAAHAILVGCLLLLAACGNSSNKPSGAAPAHEDWRTQVKVLRIGITSVEQASKEINQLDAYAAHISQRIGIPVTFVQASDYAGVVQAIAAKQIEVAITGASAYAAMYEASNGNVEPLVTNIESDGSMGYYAALFVRSDSPYHKLDDLKGKTIAYPDANSTSGYLVPRFFMRKNGIDPDTFFSKGIFAGGHAQAVVAVVNRQTDAGVTWVSGIGDVNEGYTRGQLHMMVADKSLNMKDLRVVQLFGPIPNGPTAIRKDLPQELKDLLRGVLCAMSFEDPDTFKAVTEGEGGGYVAVPHSFYQSVIEMRAQERAARRQE